MGSILIYLDLCRVLIIDIIERKAMLGREFGILHNILLPVVLVCLRSEILGKRDALMIRVYLTNTIKAIYRINLTLKWWSNSYHNFEIVSRISRTETLFRGMKRVPRCHI
jgi:hypothetical protein